MTGHCQTGTAPGESRRFPRCCHEFVTMVLEIRMTLLPEFVYDTVTKAAYVRAGDEARHKARASTPLSPCFLCCPP